MQSKYTEALKQALIELLWYEEAGLGRISSCDAIHTIREALAHQPAQRTWVRLTDEEIGKAWSVADGEHNASASVKRRITRAIEAAHNIKEDNT